MVSFSSPPLVHSHVSAVSSSSKKLFTKRVPMIVLDVVDVLGLFPRQPPSAPAIPSARRRVAGKKIETRSTNDLQLLGMKDRPDFPVPVILDRIYKLVDDPSTDSIISWSKSNKGFVIRNQEKLIRRKIYKRFFCSSFKTFISRLKHYGFSKIKRSDGLREFGNENFVRGQPMLMKKYCDSVNGGQHNYHPLERREASKGGKETTKRAAATQHGTDDRTVLRVFSSFFFFCR